MNLLPCEFCIEEECNGEQKCNCLSCKLKNICPKKLSPTIRITTKCTQSCSHCCFSCSPKKNDFMTIQISEKIKSFLLKYDIKSINLMGGEFYCNSNWKVILSNLVPCVESCRLVTNGDWANEPNINEFIKEFKKYKNLKISVSEDIWHKNKYVRKAIEILDENDIYWNLPNNNEVTEKSVVPIGRSEFEYNFYSTFSTYCSKPERKYSFLIDEMGDIFKCCFGIWKFTNIDDNTFFKSFKIFNKKFYNVGFMNCKQCVLAHNYKKNN